MKLIIRTFDYSFIADKVILKKIKKLTLSDDIYCSGMQYELHKISKKKTKPKVKVICCYAKGNLIGWGLCSKERINKEQVDFFFNKKPALSNSWIFQVYVEPYMRRKGIGKKILHHAIKKVIKDNNIYVAPHDIPSNSFFDSFQIKNKVIKI